MLYLEDDAVNLNEQLNQIEAPFVAFLYQRREGDSEYCNQVADCLSAYPECEFASGRLWVDRGEESDVSELRELSLEEGFPTDVAVLDAEENFSYGLVYPDGLVFRTRALRESGLVFDEDLEYCRDELFAMRASHVFGRRLYLPDCGYRSARVFDELSQATPQSNDPLWYWEASTVLLDKLLAKYGIPLPRNVQYALLYLTIQRFCSNENNMAKMVFADPEETDNYLESVSDLLKFIDNAVLFSRKPAVAWTRPRLLYLARLRGQAAKSELVVRKREGSVDLMVGERGSRYVLERLGRVVVEVHNLNLVTLDDGRLGFEVLARFATSFPEGSVELWLRNECSEGVLESQLKKTPILASHMAFFDREAYNFTLYHGVVPLARETCSQDISAFGRVGDMEIELRIAIENADTNHIEENDPDVVWTIPGHGVFSRDWRICVRPRTRIGKAAHELAYSAKLLCHKGMRRRAGKVRLLYWITKPYYSRQRIWVYYDKGFKGGDNGEFAYRYAASQQDGIKHRYYLSELCEDYRRMQAEGLKPLRTRRALDFMWALNAEVIFCTHITAYRTIGINKKARRYYKDLMSAEIVRMYHGFTLTHDPSYAQAHMNSMATVVGSRYEHDLYAEPVHGFAEEQIIDSGMPRHDGIVHDNLRQLLFAPTWRPTLRAGQTDDGATAYNLHFRKSRYYERYASIFGDERLLECARRTGYRIKLFLHPRMAPQTVDFPSNDVFEALDCTKDADYVTMMCQSDLMVTDYSSVMVDFAYARKPVVYYQDPALPYWRTTDFDYEGIGFGEVCRSVDELIEVLCGYMETDCALKDRYRKRIDDFFYHDDRNNSKRLYEAMRKMTDK